MWQQVYDPFGNSALSTIAAAIPVVTLLVLIATGAVKTHIAALIALAVAIVIAMFLFTMPAGLAIRAGILGAVTGFFPIGWIVLNVIFMYRLTVASGAFPILQQAIGGVTPDRRLQLLLIAFAFGAFFEGASGFGTPVAVTAAMLIGLGFSPLAASGLSLIANTAPVAYGALGTPIAGLASVTGLDPYLLGAMVGRQLPFFSLIVPAWLITAFAGWRGMVQIWPAIRSVRRLAEDHVRTVRAFADTDGGRQLLGRPHGQNDRRAINRRRIDRNQLVWSRGLDPPVCVPSLYRACLSGGRARHAAGVRLPRHGRALDQDPSDMAASACARLFH
jgi:L-lactate permease